MPRSEDLFSGSYAGRSRLSARGLLLLAVVAAAPLAIIVGGEYVQRLAAYSHVRATDTSPLIGTEVGLLEPLRPMVYSSLFSIPRPVSDAGLVASGLPVYDVRMSAKNLRRLQGLAEYVQARGVADDVTRDYLGAEFLMDGEWVPIQVKLRGRFPRHYLPTRPSLRIKFPKSRLFDGKRQINLSDPYDKELTGDVTVLWELQQHGVLAWDHRFVVLRMNGAVLGLYQEIEQFGRSLTDRQGRPEGYIYSGTGQLFGPEDPNGDKAAAAVALASECWDLEENPLEGRCGWDVFQEYFDADKWAWAAAVQALLGSRHGWSRDNLRMFWDPARGSFEPIPWDYLCLEGDDGCRPMSRTRHPEGETIRVSYGPAICAIPEFRRMRDERTWSLIDERLDGFIEHADALFEELARPLSHDGLHFGLGLDRHRHGLYIDALRQNREFLRELFSTNDVRAALAEADPGRTVLVLENHGKSFAVVEELIVEAQGVTRRLALPEVAVVDGIWFGRPGAKRVDLRVPAGARLVGLGIRNGVTGRLFEERGITTRNLGVRAVDAMVSEPESPAFRIALRGVAMEGNRIVFGPGPVVVESTVEIPRAYEVVFVPGLRLEMGAGASLHVYGDLTSVGTAVTPIEVSGASLDAAWGGILVHGTRLQPSIVRMEHTRIEGGSGGSTSRIRYTASFAVHDGRVFMRANRFLGSQAIDAVNLKYCEVESRDNVFEQSSDDAFDLDFCRGSVVGDVFVSVAGDALDLSGSDLSVEAIEVVGCGDKGISIGEKTLATVEGGTVSGCRTGIAVKDLSDAKIRGTRLLHSEVGIALYVKKPTFGPSRASVQGIEMEDVDTAYVRQGDCTLLIEGATRPSSRGPVG